MNAYPPIPANVTHFQHHYAYEIPAWISQWQWSVTFNRWSALVTFYDGWCGWTYPKTW